MSDGTDLTSRGVPALFKIFTAIWTPFTSSNALSATEESTKMHKRVSNTAEASCGGDCDWRFFDELPGSGFFRPSLEEVETERSADDCSCWRGEGGEEACLETNRRSTRI